MGAAGYVGTNSREKVEGNRGFQCTPDSVSESSTNEEFIISTKKLFLYGTSRALTTFWRRRVLYKTMMQFHIPKVCQEVKKLLNTIALNFTKV